jgi:hypothetical protein
MGIAYTGLPPQLIDSYFSSANSKTPGLGGLGGGGSAINAGENGISADLFAFDQPYVGTPIICPPGPPSGTGQCFASPAPAEAISGCTFALPPRARLYPSNVNVLVTAANGTSSTQGGLVCAPSECPSFSYGWTFDDSTSPKSITLCPELCALLDATHQAMMTLGCPTIGATKK